MEKKQEEEKKKNLEGLPVETSPYTQYKDLDEYKKQGYGAEGHLHPNPGRGAAASTDAPTATADDPNKKPSSTGTTNSQGFL